LAAPIVAAEFEQRVLSHPGFEADGLLLAIGAEGEVLGAAHAIAPPVSLPRFASLAGQGFLFGPYVRSGSRGRGIGGALLDEAERHLKDDCPSLSIHGLRSPFYHWQEGPRQPYCGSTEMIGLGSDDTGLLGFLDARGYRRAAAHEVSLWTRLRRFEFDPPRLQGHRFLRIRGSDPWPGSVAWATGELSGYGYERYGSMAYDTVAVAQGETILGHCQWYPMREVGRAALYDLRLDPSLRGRGIGRALLDGGLAAMAEEGFLEAELHASPERNPVAFPMYQQLGFREVANWIVLEKRLR
jgi:ribosomal protein S18 acetylase RimI-like enzyme